MIAPIREKPTVITVTIPKLLIILKLEIISAANPKTVVIPDTDIAVPSCVTPCLIASMSSFPLTLFVYPLHDKDRIFEATPLSGPKHCSHRRIIDSSTYIIRPFQPTIIIMG